MIESSNEKERKKEEIISDNVMCSNCFSGHTISEENDILLCDGEHCFRSFHFRCVYPPVTQKMLDSDEEGTWFCPYCTIYANTIHYIQAEYMGDEWDERNVAKDTIGNDRNGEKVLIDEEENQSIISWNNAEDIFPEAPSELDAAMKWNDGIRDGSCDYLLGSLIGVSIENNNNHDTCQVDHNELSDGSDESFDTDLSHSVTSDDVSQVKWDIDKSEIDALSSCSDGDLSSSSDKSNGKRCRKTRSKVSTKSQSSEYEGNESISIRSANIDVGTVDKSNIISGKRNRTKVDYRRLNDALFGDMDSSDKAKILDDDADDDW